MTSVCLSALTKSELSDRQSCAPGRAEAEEERQEGRGRGWGEGTRTLAREHMSESSALAIPRSES